MISDTATGATAAGPYLEGQLLLAMPGIGDERFDRTMIYLCSHSKVGAMGLVLNRSFQGLNFAGLLGQLNMTVPGTIPDVPPYMPVVRWSRDAALCCTATIISRRAVAT